jgi:DNA invertase Pin-like site-specific DNA recombinase
VIDRHHRDSDRMNNDHENIAFLCRRHHSAAHRASDGKIGGGPRPRVAREFREAAIARAHEGARLRDAGASTAEIARSLAVDPKTVTRWFRKYAV